MDEISEIDKNEKMRKDIAKILERLTVIENKINAIAKFFGVIGYDFGPGVSYAQMKEIEYQARMAVEKCNKRRAEKERKKKEKEQKLQGKE
jgi:hypothetical protein